MAPEEARVQIHLCRLPCFSQLNNCFSWPLASSLRHLKLCVNEYFFSLFLNFVPTIFSGCAPAFSTRRPARRAAGQLPAAGENFKKKPLRFQFLYTNINFNLKSTQFELSKTRILSKTHLHTHTHVRTHSCHNTNMKIDLHMY